MTDSTPQHTDTTALVGYEQARQALERVRDVDEAKGIVDRAVALRAYARQAGDEELLRWATEIKIRAERRAGVILHDMYETRNRQTPGGDRKSSSSGNEDDPPALAEFGISWDKSSQWQQLAAIPEDIFEGELQRVRADPAQATTRGILKKYGPGRPVRKPAPVPAARPPRRPTGVRLPSWYALFTDRLAEISTTVLEADWTKVPPMEIQWVGERFQTLAASMDDKLKHAAGWE